MEDKLKLAKDIVASFPQDQRSAFLEKYKSLESDEQRMAIIDKVVTKFGGRIKTEVPAESKTIIKEDRPSLSSEAGKVGLQFLSGASQGLLDTGRKPISELVAGNVGQNIMQGANYSKNAKEALMRFAMAGGQGLAQTQQTVQEPTLNSMVGFPVLPQPETQGGQIAGAVANLAGQSAILPFLKGRGTLIEPTEIKTERGINNFIRSIYKAKSEASKAYGANLDALVQKNPSVKADLSNFMSELKQRASFDPKIQAAIKRSPKLDAALTEYEKTGTSNLNIKDVQMIANEFKTSNKAAFNSRLVDPIQRDIKGIHQDLKYEQAKLFPEEMGKANEKYAQVANDFKQIRSKLSGDTTEGFIKRKLGGTKSKNAVERLLKDNPEALKNVKKLGADLAFDAFKKDLAKKALRATVIGGAGALGAGGIAKLLWRN